MIDKANGKWKLAIVGVLLLAIFSWGVWLSRTAVLAYVDNARICQMAEDIKEIKAKIDSIYRLLNGQGEP